MDVAISAGRFKGKKLRFPDDSDFRPTKSMVREAICSSIQMEIAGARVLELCGGSGVFSLELISRGAESATIVELDAKRSKAIEKTVEELGVNAEVNTICGDVCRFIQHEAHKYDIIFFDPPYYINELTNMIPEALTHLNYGGVLIFESATDDRYVETVELPSNIQEKKKKYGKTTVRYFRVKE